MKDFMDELDMELKEVMPSPQKQVAGQPQVTAPSNKTVETNPRVRQNI
jgi:hypothetical protein